MRWHDYLYGARDGLVSGGGSGLWERQEDAVTQERQGKRDAILYCKLVRTRLVFDAIHET